MIQRKQTLWLLIAALLNACVFLLGIYRYHVLVNGVDTVKELVVGDNYPTIIIAVAMTLIPLVTLFMYSNRKRQMRMTAYAMVAEAAFIFALLVRVNKLSSLVPPPTSGSYWIGSILPVAAMVFLFMAISGIRKDEKLVKSLDRLR
jgi:uncharacterized protein DUF4293